MKYHISEIAAALDISVETVRNYEKCGLIEPSRNERNNYREYNAIDINLIRRARSYMSYGFSLSEATDLIHHQDLLGLAQKMESREAELQKKLEDTLNQLMYIRQHAEHIRRISASDGECMVQMSPAFYGILYREGLKKIENEELQEVASQWNCIHPFAETFLLYDRSCFNGIFQYKAGLRIDAAYASYLGIKESEYVRYYPAKKSIYMMSGRKFEAEVNPEDELFEFARMADYAREKGLTLSGDVVANVLHTSRSTGKWIHHIECWVPVE